MDRLRILLISPIPTHPLNAGNRARVVTLLEALRELGHNVHFLHVQQESGDDDAMRLAWGDAYSAFPWERPRPLIPRIRRKLFGWISDDIRYSYDIDEWYDEALDQQLKDLHARNSYDVVIASYVFFSRCLECFGPETLKVIDTHDAFSNRHRHYLSQGEKPKWFSTSPRGESKALNRADVVIAIQDKERELFASMSRAQVITVGHITPLSSPSESIRAGEILFVASNNDINAHGIRLFLAESLPRIRQECPHAELVLAGSIGNCVPDQDGVRKLGHVDDLNAVYASAEVVINPVEFNTGLSIKNLEALGLGKALVTLEAGADGLAEGKGQAFLSAESQSAMASAVISLLRDGEKVRQFERAALEFARTLNRQTVEALEQVLRPRKASS
ncbi:MAG: glycosyltransferase family 4 protein [Pseudomonadales bacterium]|nr:glycosyltransferase family 4 protein [Pseudomonadales bacterium]MCP5182381.1 glycosyltransferase family 4 protein [Pseudomonadales bacterium]